MHQVQFHEEGSSTRSSRRLLRAEQSRKGPIHLPKQIAFKVASHHDLKINDPSSCLFQKERGHRSSRSLGRRHGWTHYEMESVVERRSLLDVHFASPVSRLRSPRRTTQRRVVHRASQIGDPRLAGDSRQGRRRRYRRRVRGQGHLRGYVCRFSGQRSQQSKVGILQTQEDDVDDDKVAVSSQETTSSSAHCIRIFFLCTLVFL